MDLGVPGFETDREIGRGGFGIVYLARDVEHQREVALKVLTSAIDDTTRRRFDRERRAMGLLSGHPHIATVYTSGYTPGGAPFLVMELLTGGSLRDRMRVDGALRWPLAVELGVKLADALEFAHGKGVLHRDLKPENVLLSPYGEPKMTDFGIAVLTGEANATRTSVSATPLYAPPEVFDGAPPDARSDVYSLAATLFALIEGRPAYSRGDDTSVLTTLARIATDPVPRLAGDVPEPVRTALWHAMSKDPDQRPETAGAFAESLRTAMAESAEPAERSVGPSASTTTIVAPGLTGDDARAVGGSPPPPPAPPAARSPEAPTAPPAPVAPPPRLERPPSAPPPAPAPATGAPPAGAAPAPVPTPAPRPTTSAASAGAPAAGDGPAPPPDIELTTGASARPGRARSSILWLGVAALVVVVAGAVAVLLTRGDGGGSVDAEASDRSGGAESAEVDTSATVAGGTVVVVPDVVGQRLGPARDELTRAGFRVSWPAHCDDTVLGQDPPAGAQVPSGSNLELQLPACVVPEVIGLSLDEGVALLRRSGFAVTWPDHCQDLITGQRPAPGTEAEPGDEVALDLPAC